MTSVASAAPANEQEVAQLAQENLSLAREITSLKSALINAEQLIGKLKFEIAQLTRRQFGSSGEGLAQLLLWQPGAEPENAPPALVGTILVPTHERAKPIRRPLPDELPRVVIEIDLPEEQKHCPCCGGQRHVIGEEVSEKLDIEPARMTVQQYRRKIYGCRPCDGQVETASMPPQIIEQGMATAGLLAHVAVAKFCDHLPLARQERIFARHGIEIPRSTLTDWMLATGQALDAPVQRLGELIKSKDIIGSDDTTMPWQNERKGKTTTARLWAWRAEVEPGRALVLYQFTPDRSGKHPRQFLRGWKGYLQADAYSGYDEVFDSGEIIEVGCFAHCRRKFFEVAKAARTRGFAHEMVERIGELYRVEREAKDQHLDAVGRKLLRQEKAKPVLDEILKRLEEHLPKILPKSPLGQAIGYALNQWEALNRYLEDGRLQIDNNALEQIMRPVALGRKNFLFVASERGGQAVANFYSLIESAKACGLNPYVYLRSLLTRLPSTKMRDIDTLLPHCWQPDTS